MTTTDDPVEIIQRDPGVEDPLDADLPPLLDRLYRARGIRDRAELDYRLQCLPRPEGLGQLEAAAQRLAEAIQRDERILVVGDFDADGATSCAVAIRGMASMGAGQVDYLVPNRFADGYGLSAGLVEPIMARRPAVVVTVDNGISAIEGVAALQAAGVGVLVTDHHFPGPQLPNADAIVNPRVNAPDFGAPNLAGVGVCFYLMLATRAVLRERDWFGPQRPEPALAELLDLVAIGTVADVVALDYCNRLLVEQGLRRIRAGKASAGVAALMDAAGRDRDRANAADLGFGVAPRLNAAGRLDDMAIGIETLLARAPDTAAERARRLEAFNRERRALEQGMREQAVDALEPGEVGDERHLGPILCVYDERWHQGLVGIVAGRLKERYRRAVIALAPDQEGRLKGSARSVDGLHIRDLLEAVHTRSDGQLMERFGGHAMAAGMTLKPGQLDAFTRLVESIASEWLGAVPPQTVITTDGPLAADEFSLAQAQHLRRAGPWGAGFPEPCFYDQFAVVDARIVGERHIKMRLRPRQCPGQVIDAIAFGAAETHERLPAGDIEAVYRLDVNRYRGEERLQLIIDYLAA
ncbi:single-stranded-DNA-specific exonuclease RecJ [Spiribacter pallidus]|uniref:single-stranded-DNA-specific exonuclease RecJ n=1 Tax=Spiribacter pallidus TaxID=1987936 RepID=UPI00349FBF60